MSEPYNDIGFSERKSPLSMNRQGMREKTSAQAISLPSDAAGHAQSMREILAEHRSNIYAERVKSNGMAAVGWKELLAQYPPVKTEADVDIAADILVRVFSSPKSRGFYCDCARHLDRESVTQAVYLALQIRTNRPITNPPAYFGRICTKKLTKLGIYK